MSDALTSTDKRLNLDANLAVIRRLLNGKESIFPSYFGTFGKFSRQFLCESGGAITEHCLHFASRFSPVSAFVAIV
jgi:hypothetical protein